MKISDVVVGHEYYRVVHIKQVKGIIGSMQSYPSKGFRGCCPLQRVRVIEKVKRRFIIEVPTWKCERDIYTLACTWRHTTSKVETFASKLRELT